MEEDGVVLVVGRLVLAVEPHLAGLSEEPDLPVYFDHPVQIVFLILVDNEDQLFNKLYEGYFWKDLSGNELDGGKVNAVAVLVIEQQEQEFNDIFSSFRGLA